MRENIRKYGSVILFLLGVLVCGATGAALAARLAGVHFSLRLWPLIACIDVFVFATVGFFKTTGRIEILYGVCSIASVACTIVQLAILF